MSEHPTARQRLEAAYEGDKAAVDGAEHRRLAATYRHDPQMERLKDAAAMTTRQRVALGHYLAAQEAAEVVEREDG